MRHTRWIVGAFALGACLMAARPAEAQYWGGGRGFGLSINIGSPAYGWGLPSYGYGPTYVSGWGIPASTYAQGWPGVGYPYTTVYTRSYTVAPTPLVVAPAYTPGYSPWVVRRSAWGWGPRPVPGAWGPGPWARPYPVRWW